MKLIPSKLRSARLIRCITQKTLADKIGVTKQAVYQYEEGLSNPTNATLDKIAEALDFPLMFFIIPYKKEIKVTWSTLT